MALSFRNIEMASFTPYSGRFAGYSIRRGKLSADLNYRLNERKLEADHKIVIDQLELGDKVESADSIGLPLKLAVALLRDRNGVIDIELPVAGSLDDPQFRVGPIIWKVFVNLLSKAVTAPFATAGQSLRWRRGCESHQLRVRQGGTLMRPHCRSSTRW